MILVQTKSAEYVFRQQGPDVFMTFNGSPEGILRNNEFVAAGAKNPSAKLEAQPDQRTIHVDKDKRTLGILLVAGVGNQVVPRAFEFVDLKSAEDRTMLEALSFYYLITQNIES